MNDYLGDSHEAIYDMVKSGLPGQVRAWSADVARVHRSLFTSIGSLRKVLTELPEVWSDGAGSELFSADLTAVADYLEALGDGLSGRPGSYADLIAQSAADLDAAQSPAALPQPPPPGMDTASLQSDHALSNRVIADPVVRAQSDAVYSAEIAKAEAARILAGTTATHLDDQYRTVLARVTAPPPPPPIVLGAAGTRGTDAVLAGGTDGTEAGGSGGSGPGLTVGGPNGSHAISGGSGAAVASGPAMGVGWSGTAEVPAATAFEGSPSAPASGAGGGLTGGGMTGGVPVSALRRPGVVSADHRSASPVSASTASGLGRGVTVGELAGRRFVGPEPVTVGRGFDAVTGAAVTAGPGLFGSGAGDPSSPRDTVTGVGGIAALAVGAAFLARGSAGGVAAAGVSGLGAGASRTAGVDTSGVRSAGSAPAGGAANAGLPTGAGPATTSSGGAEVRSIAGPTNGVNSATSLGGNSMVQGGQIGQSGRPASTSPGYASGRPAAAGAGIGGEHGYRVTWLVEDRDLYRIGPSVAPVVESVAVVDSVAETTTTGAPPTDIS